MDKCKKSGIFMPVCRRKMELPFIRDAGIRFDDGKIGIITLNVAEFNKSAQRCYEKCGFTIYDEMYKNGNRTLKMRLIRTE